MPTRILGADTVARLNDYQLLGLVQSIEYSPNFNAQDITELGNSGKVDSSIEVDFTGSIELIDSGAIPGILARMNLQRNASQVPTGYQFVSGGAGGKNAYTIAETDMDELVFDLLIHEKTDQQNWNRTIVLPRCFMTSFSGRADANGTGSATINFANDFVMGLDSPNHDVKSLFATRTTSLTGTTVNNGATLTNYDVVAVYINERRFTKVNTAATYVSGFVAGTGVFTLTTSESYVIPTDAHIRVILYKTTAPSSLFLGVNSGEQGTTARYLKGFMTSIYLAPSSVTAPVASEQWLKVQSCDWSFDLRNNALRQIAYNPLGSSVYFRGSTYPFDVTVNATVNESDWLDWKAVLDPAVKTFTGDVTNSMYDLAPASLKTSFNLVIIQYTRGGSKLAEYRFTDMRLDNRSQRMQVGDVEQATWSLKGTKYTIIGYNN